MSLTPLADELFLPQLRIRGGQPGDRDTRARARYVIQTQVMAKANSFRVSALLAADADLEIIAHSPAARHGHFYELTDTLDVEHFKRIVLQDADFVVQRQEFVFRILA